MIVGSGLIAKAFYSYGHALRDFCIYAAGVSNSSCNDPHEFLRDRERLRKVLSVIPNSMPFVYFSTCSIGDPSLADSRYVAYKNEMERLVRKRGGHLIVRLPQVVGNAPNPHTLLNFLETRIRCGEPFVVWRWAVRNIIDVDDVARIVSDLLLQEGALNETLNVASSRSSSLFDIVEAIERATGSSAVYSLIDRGAEYPICTARIARSVERCGIVFDEDYLDRTIEKYYGKSEERLLAGVYRQ